ncbi:hypothetical protein Corgl_0206 [Coriobacterium glomerans PW2]|uniref:NLP/P60 protein n=2 Tax=Coriobacterium TaxID=33870 RepID=F2NAE7_CORGP|nr:hypothetical protein Corgl_0206 [Coriobacterium glomerans PW2]
MFHCIGPKSWTGRQHPESGNTPPRVTSVKSITRRSAMRALVGLTASALLLGSPVQALAEPSASKETLDKLGDAESQLASVQAKLDEIAAHYQQLAKAQDETLSQIEQTQAEIESKQAEIESKQAELKAKRAVLSERVSASYKTRGNDALALLLSSASFEDLISNAYYLDAMNQRDHDAIAEVQKIERELDREKSELEGKKSELEDLRDKQAQQLAAAQADQAQVQTVLDSASAEVKDLMAQRDAEIMAAAQAEAEKKRLDALAHANVTPPPAPTGGAGQGVDGLSGAQSRVLNSCNSTPCPGASLCAAWVSNVFQNAGLGSVSGNANDMYSRWCTSSNKDSLKVGMIVAVSTYTKTTAGRTYGHVGIYVGNNQIMESIGYIHLNDLNSWIAYYGDTVTPRWGWANGIDLSTRG